MADEFGKFSQPQDVAEADAKALQENTKAWEADTKAIAANMQKREQWTRLAKKNIEDHETLLGLMKEEGKAAASWTKNLFSLQRQYREVSGAVGGFANQLAQAATISATYSRKLEAMREGQQAFTKSLVATTGDTATAMRKSQQYVNAVHDSYASAYKMAGEYAVEVGVVKQATNELNARFATQIAVSGDMRGAIEGMRKEAFIFGRYLGVEMTEVMDAWQTQMRYSTRTLKEVREEFVDVTYTTDKYAKELRELGEDALKTANIGKRELVTMVMEVGKEMRTGMYDAAAYARMLKGLLIEGKKAGATVEEQRIAAEGMKKFLTSVYKFGTEQSLFGTTAAQKIIGRIERGEVEFRDAAIQSRIDYIMKNISQPLQRLRAVMNAIEGTAEGDVLVMESTRELLKGNKELATEMFAKGTEGSVFIASQLSEQLLSGRLEAAARQKAEDTAADQRGEQVDTWKKYIEDATKAAATPLDTDYAMLKEVEEIRGLLASYIAQQPWMAVGLQLGGALLGKIGSAVLGRIGARMAGRALAGAGAQAGVRVAGGGMTAAMAAMKGTTTAAAAPGAGAALGGLGAKAAGALGALKGAGAAAAPLLPYIVNAGLIAGVGYGAYKTADAAVKALSKAYMSETEARIAGTKDYRDYAAAWAAYDEKTMREITRLRGGEYEARKKQIKSIETQIKEYEEWGDRLSGAEKERLAALKREKAAIEKDISYRTKAERKEVARDVARFSSELQRTMIKRMGKLQFGAAGNMEQLARDILFKQVEGAGGTQLQWLTQAGAVQDIMKAAQATGQLGQLGAGQQAQLLKQLQFEVARQRFMAERPGEDIGKYTQAEIIAFVRKLKGAEVSTFDAPTAQALGAAKPTPAQVVISADTGGEGAPTTVTTNARGQMTMQLPGQKLVIEAPSMGAAVAETQQRTTRGTPG